MFQHGPSTPGAWVTAAAYPDGGDWLADVVGYLDGSRELLAGWLARHLPGVRYQAPEGTYLAWPTVATWTSVPPGRAQRLLRGQGRVL